MARKGRTNRKNKTVTRKAQRALKYAVTPLDLDALKRELELGDLGRIA